MKRQDIPLIREAITGVKKQVDEILAGNVQSIEAVAASTASDTDDDVYDIVITPRELQIILFSLNLSLDSLDRACDDPEP